MLCELNYPHHQLIIFIVKELPSLYETVTLVPNCKPLKRNTTQSSHIRKNPPAPKRGKRIYYFSQPKAFLYQNAALNISTISSLVSGTKEPFEPSQAFCAIISKFLSSVIPTALRFEGIPIVSKKNFFRASIPA